MIQFGTYDPKLIEMRSIYNINVDVPKEKPWGSDLPLQIFTKLLTEAANELDDIAIRGND